MGLKCQSIICIVVLAFSLEAVANPPPPSASENSAILKILLESEIMDERTEWQFYRPEGHIIALRFFSAWLASLLAKRVAALYLGHKPGDHNWVATMAAGSAAVWNSFRRVDMVRIKCSDGRIVSMPKIVLLRATDALEGISEEEKEAFEEWFASQQTRSAIPTANGGVVHDLPPQLPSRRDLRNLSIQELVQAIKAHKEFQGREAERVEKEKKDTLREDRHRRKKQEVLADARRRELAEMEAERASTLKGNWEDAQDPEPFLREHGSTVEREPDANPPVQVAPAERQEIPRNFQPRNVDISKKLRRKLDELPGHVQTLAENLIHYLETGDNGDEAAWDIHPVYGQHNVFRGRLGLSYRMSWRKGDTHFILLDVGPRENFYE